jgi:hypothetical protein
MNYQINYETNPTSEDIQVLNDGIMEQAKQKKGMRQLDFFAFLFAMKMEKLWVDVVVTTCMAACMSDNYELSNKASWRKLHVAVNQNHYFEACVLTDRYSQDDQQVEPLLEQINETIDYKRFTPFGSRVMINCKRR